MKNLKIYYAPAVFAPVMLLAACLFFSGCYSLSQGFTFLGYLNRAIPLEEADDEDFIRLVNDIRAFAMEELGLAQSRNYTRYVELDRDYLAAVVSASARDSFRRHEWWFPVVGTLPYKGFFNAEDARKEREKLEKQDLDVWIRGVDAFSTLGWFRDPLFSYMKSYSPDRLANLIIHELVHSTVFIKGQAQFNEELAEFIGTEGARLFIIKQYGLDSAEYQNMIASAVDSRSFVLFVQELIAELDILYSGGDRELILAEKERIINAAKVRFDAEYDSRFTSGNYRGFSSLAINNAYLELFRLYYTPDNFYEDLYNSSGQDLTAFIAAAKTITERGEEPRVQLKAALESIIN